MTQTYRLTVVAVHPKLILQSVDDRIQVGANRRGEPENYLEVCSTDHIYKQLILRLIKHNSAPKGLDRLRGPRQPSHRGENNELPHGVTAQSRVASRVS